MATSNLSNYTQVNLTYTLLAQSSSVASTFPPTEVWVGLVTTVPNLANIADDGTTEINGGHGMIEVPTTSGGSPTGYSRVRMTGVNHVSDQFTTLFTNSADLNFGTPASNWGILRGAVLFDGSASNARILASYNFATARAADVGASDIIILQNNLRLSRAIC